MTQAAEYRPLIRDMPVDERPRERLRMRGPEALTNAELVAILLRTGTNGENPAQKRAGPLAPSMTYARAGDCEKGVAGELGENLKIRPQQA